MCQYLSFRGRGQSGCYCCGRTHRDTSPANHLLSPSSGIRLMSKPASDCCLIHSATLNFSLFKHRYTVYPLSQGVLSLMNSYTFMSDPLVSPLPLFRYSVCPGWWMSSHDATLTCICPLCFPISFTYFFLVFAFPFLGSLHLISSI